MPTPEGAAALPARRVLLPNKTIPSPDACSSAKHLTIVFLVCPIARVVWPFRWFKPGCSPAAIHANISARLLPIGLDGGADELYDLLMNKTQRIARILGGDNKRSPIFWRQPVRRHLSHCKTSQCQSPKQRLQPREMYNIVSRNKILSLTLFLTNEG